MAVDQHQHTIRAQVTQVDFGGAVAAVVERGVQRRTRRRNFLEDIADGGQAGAFDLFAGNDQNRLSGFEVGALDARAGDLDRAQLCGVAVCRKVVSGAVVQGLHLYGVILCGHGCDRQQGEPCYCGSQRRDPTELVGQSIQVKLHRKCPPTYDAPIRLPPMTRPVLQAQRFRKYRSVEALPLNPTEGTVLTSYRQGTVKRLRVAKTY